jgi:hypothetical protein
MPGSQHSKIDKKRSKQRSTEAATSPAKTDTGNGNKRGLELWKIIVGALVALLLSTGFISATIPKYKLQIKSPVLKKDNVYQAQAGSVTIKWTLLREQWFREVDVARVKANVSLKKSGDEKEQRFQDSPGEVTVNLQPGI